jgi:hypothetical protein
LNISTLEERIQKLDLEIDTPLAEKKKTQERERKRAAGELRARGSSRKGEAKKESRTPMKRSRTLFRGDGASCTIYWVECNHVVSLPRCL